MPPKTSFPSFNFPSILNPSYTKLSAKATSLLNPSVTSPARRVHYLPCSAPNLTQFQSLFGKHLLKFQYKLSSLKLLVSLTVLQLLFSCSDSSGHSVHRTIILHFLMNPNSNQLQFLNCSSSIIHCGTA